MVYKIMKNNSLQSRVFQDNRLAPRSYFIPFPSYKSAKETSIIEQRRESGRIILLNGEWGFKYFSHSYQLKELDTTKTEFDEILVPSCWQMQGYEPHCYLASAYEFSNLPPRVPVYNSAGVYEKEGQEPFRQFNSAGVYKKTFLISKANKRVLATFLGVSGSLELYVNGKYIGYGEGGRTPSEFDITGELIDGENELIAIVRKWSSGSYLESFDSFRMNGIFRDVYLTVCDHEHIFDISINTIKLDDKYNANINIKVHNNEKSTLKVVLQDKDKVIAHGTYYSSDEVVAEFSSLQVQEWNAEQPYLYSLYVLLIKDGAVRECVRKEVGFKHIEITDGRFYLNDALIKLKGVKYYETDPLHGFCLNADKLERDLSLMKAFNINAVSCPYPLDPLFYQLADQMGLYVIGQAEIRASGSFSGLIKQKARGLADSPRWSEHFKDRVLRMYHAHKNSVSILLYSIGEDSGGGKCIEEAYKALKAVNYSTPIFYADNGQVATEANAIACVKKADLNMFKHLCGRTAPGNRLLTELVRKSPIILAKFASGRGVGSGGLEEYIEQMYANDNILGVFVTDFCDQMVYSLDNDAKYRDIYGGDSGEYKHNGAECLRGMFYSDRKAKPFAHYVRKVFSPINAVYVGREIQIRNNNNFTDTSNWRMGLQPIINTHPQKEVLVEHTIPVGGKYSVNIDIPEDAYDMFVNLNLTNPFGGEYIYQLAIKEMLLQLDIVKGEELSLVDFPNQAKIYFKGGFVEFDKRFGAVIKYNVNGYDYIKTEPLKKKGMGSISTEIYRAPLVNDDYIRQAWLDAGFRDFTIQTRFFDIKMESTQAKIYTEIDFIGIKGERLCTIKDIYTIHSNGRLDIDCSLEPGRKLPPLPRFGSKFQLQYELQKVEYYGRGPWENFTDMKSHCPMGVYRGEVNDFYQPYIKPQDSGYKEDTRYAIFRNPKGAGIMILAGRRPFVLNAQYTESQKIDGFTHKEDVATESTVYVSVDAFVHGTKPNEDAIFTPSLQYSIIPLSVGMHQAREYARISSNE